MKKISILLLLVIGLAACDMDLKPHSSIEENEAVQTLNDCRKFRNGLYVNWRGLSTGGYLIYSEIQTDNFNGVIGNGNRLGSLYTGTIQPQTTEITNIWANYYSIIAKANFIINKMEAMEGQEKIFTEEELKELRRYLGEAYITRAFCHYNLIDKFSPAYTESNKDAEAQGVPLVTLYEPSSLYEKYPGRNTLGQGYTLINEDLSNAVKYLEEYENFDKTAAPKAESVYMTSDFAKALQARVALSMKDYPTALKISETLINDNRYPLVKRDTLQTMWENDEGKEIVFLVHMTEIHRGSPTGQSFLSDKDLVDYLPTKEVVDLYEKEDIRRDVYLKPKKIITTGGEQTVFVFSKFAGNMNLQTAKVPEYRNMGKPVRSAEFYLIAAEAASKIPGQEATANKYLNALRQVRIDGYKESTYSGVVLTNEIELERRRELIGEGFRFGDLKRWGKGFKRAGAHAGYNEMLILRTGNQDQLSYEANDYRFVWPIPKGEIDANPQIEKQQNPGY